VLLTGGFAAGTGAFGRTVGTVFTGAWLAQAA
jgi:hypothetical protein